MAKVFHESAYGAGNYHLYYVWSIAANWTPAAAPIAGDDLAYTAVGSGSDQQADDIAGLTLSSLLLAATAAASETVYVGGALTIGTLTLTSVGAKTAMLEATNTFGTTPVVTINAIAPGSSGILFSYGAGAAIIDKASSDPGGLTYEPANGGLIELTGAPALSSNLKFFDASGVIALANPPAFIASPLTGVRPGDAIELPGTRIAKVTVAASSLTLQTDAASVAFTNVSYAAATTASYYGVFDQSTGLEKIVLGETVTMTDASSTVAPAYYANDYQWSNPLNWSTGEIPNAGDVIILDNHPGATSGHTFVMDTNVNLADLIVTSTSNAIYRIPIQQVVVSSNVAVDTLELSWQPTWMYVESQFAGLPSSTLTVSKALDLAYFDPNQYSYDMIGVYDPGARVNIDAALPTNLNYVLVHYNVYNGGTFHFGTTLGSGYWIDTNGVAGTMIEFANPESAITGYFNLTDKLSIELPGSALVYASFGATSLSVVTDAGSYTFSNVEHRSPTQVWGMTVSHDATTGLEKIVFSQNATAVQVLTSGAGIVNGAGKLSAGATVTFSVYVSGAVTVNTTLGSPSLSLSDGGVATYTGGSGANILTFTHVVQAGQRASDLSVTAFNYNNAVILDPGSNPALLGGAVGNPAGLLTVGSNATARDFNADGKSDILFRNAAGVTYLWTMNGASVASGATTSVQVGANWQIKGVADFNGDGASDLLWVYNNASNASDALNGVSYVSYQNGATASGGGVVQQLSSVWQVAGTGDFNGDGKADVLYRNTSSGQTYLDVMNGAAINWIATGFTSQQVTGSNWSIAATGDFNGDGMADVLWRYNNASNAADALNGVLYEWRMNGTTVTGAGLLGQEPGSAKWNVIGGGDFNGDGNADILLRYNNASNAADALNGVTYIDFMNATNVLGASAPTQWQIDNSWAIASIGDFNGDGKSDILWQQTSTGNTYIWQMNGANVAAGATTSQQAGSGWTVQNGVHVG